MNEPQTSTATSSSASPAVKGAVDSIANGLKTEVGKPAAVFGSSLYSPAGSTTNAGWQSALTAANNPGYSTAINGAIDSLGKAASGGDYNQAGGAYDTLRTNAADDALKTVNGVFNNSGRFGGGTHAEAAGEGVTNALAGLDVQQLQNNRQWQATAAGLLPQAFQGSLAPSAAIGAVGAAQDANQQGILQGNNDLFRRQNDANLAKLAQEGSVLTGTSGAAGTQQTTTQPGVPWYQSLLGGALTAASFL